MLLLSVDSSAVTASAALTDGQSVLKSELLNKGLTHSETLLPLIESVMDGRSYAELGAIAVTVGPGSFTGVRIGVAAVKGLAFADDIPCVPVSTLEAIAYNFIDENAVVCAVMDARRTQFYNALFRAEKGKITRLCEDRAISAADLEKELLKYEKVIIAGDGARLFYGNTELKNAVLAEEGRIYQNGVGVALAARGKEKIKPEELRPVYLRPSQAERELKLKKEMQK